MIKLLAALFLGGFVAASAAAPRDLEQRRIEYLIGSIAALHDAKFIRNGSAHDATQAADHLREKWRRAGGRVRTAEDFINYCATGSSLSGESYRIRFADGREIESAAYLRAKLAQYDPTR